MRISLHLPMLSMVAFVGFGLIGWNTTVAQPPPPTPTDPYAPVEPEVLTRGPVHEAFAETVIYDPEPDVVVTMAPPEAIDEFPPDQRPDGPNVAWIPGYWAWDDEQNDFLWVSGIWRALPPSRQWVPGYWARSPQGYFWTPGYWAEAEVTEVDYLPEPPETVEAGPNIEPPSPEFFWVPGVWVWYQGHYAWRPGYWADAYPDWVWVPSHYVWAPPGYVYVDGYWDYEVQRRGVLFAPVRFEPAVYVRRDVHYSPTIAIDLNIVTDHLFVRPRYHHYYFGDYYAVQYEDRGYRPTFSFQVSRYGYDPIYVHQRWRHRNDRDWNVRVEADFLYRREREDCRPPRTLAAMRRFVPRDNEPRDRRLVIAASLEVFAKRQDSPIRFRSVDQDERKQIRQRGQEVRTTRDERQALERKDVDISPEKRPREDAPARRKMARSTTRSRPADQADRDQGPPQRKAAPPPDTKVEPKRRTPGKHKITKEDAKKGDRKP